MFSQVSHSVRGLGVGRVSLVPGPFLVTGPCPFWGGRVSLVTGPMFLQGGRVSQRDTPPPLRYHTLGIIYPLPWITYPTEPQNWAVRILLECFLVESATVHYNLSWWKNPLKQDRIPVGCILPTWKPYVSFPATTARCRSWEWVGITTRRH